MHSLAVHWEGALLPTASGDHRFAGMPQEQREIVKWSVGDSIMSSIRKIAPITWRLIQDWNRTGAFFSAHQKCCLPSDDSFKLGFCKNGRLKGSHCRVTVKYIIGIGPTMPINTGDVVTHQNKRKKGKFVSNNQWNLLSRILKNPPHSSCDLL